MNKTLNTNKFYNDLLVGPTVKFEPKKVKNLQTIILSISPEEARHILKFYNQTNRRPSSTVVGKYANDMINGNWKLTSQAISFNTDGKLVNGQHRLLACSKVGMTQKFSVAFGESIDSMDVLDGGKNRTNADILDMYGYDNAATISTLVRSIIAYKSSGKCDAKAVYSLCGVNQISKSDILNFLQENSDTMEYVEKYKKSQIVSASVTCFCHWLLSQNDQEKAESYLDQIFLGYNLEPNTIQNYIYSKFQRNKNTYKNKMNKTEIIANVIQGWRRVMGYSKTKTLCIQWRPEHGLPDPNA